VGDCGSNIVQCGPHAAEAGTARLLISAMRGGVACHTACCRVVLVGIANDSQMAMLSGDVFKVYKPRMDF